MPESRPIWLLAPAVPLVFAGPTLHRWGLEAMHAGNLAAADRLFEAAAVRYRADLAIEALARVRVHQAMARVRAEVSPDRRVCQAIETELLLSRLDRIEALTPPFDLVDARSLLATWLSESHGNGSLHEVGGARSAA